MKVAGRFLFGFSVPFHQLKMKGCFLLPHSPCLGVFLPGNPLTGSMPTALGRTVH